jgi:hypothetical protein
MLIFVCSSTDFKNKCIAPEGFIYFFNLPINKKRLVIFTHNDACYITELLLMISDHWFLHTSAAETLLALLPMSLSWPLSQSRLLCNHPSHMAWDASEGFQCCWLGLASPYLACLDLAADPKSEISSTCKSHGQTSQVRITQTAQRQCTQYIFYFILQSHGLIKKGQLAQNNLFGHNIS